MLSLVLNLQGMLAKKHSHALLALGTRHEHTIEAGVDNRRFDLVEPVRVLAANPSA